MFPFSHRPSLRIIRSLGWGFPIRTPTDHRMFGSSPSDFGAVRRPSSARPRLGIPHVLSFPCAQRALALALSPTLAIFTW